MALEYVALIICSSTTSTSAEDLEKEFAAVLAEQKPEETAPAAQQASRGATVRYIDMGFDLLGAAGYSTVDEDELRMLQAGGHDPINRGFTLQNAELVLGGVVDPYLRGDVNIVFQIDSEGETNIELEEAYLTTLDLPFALQLKAGQFLTAFGRLNPSHPHTWDFVDSPVVSTALLGPDGVRNPGLQISWLSPLPFFLELTGSVQNANSVVKDPLDWMYLAHLKSSFDIGEETTIVLGFSGLFGPREDMADENARTSIYGVDLYAKWKPLTNDKGWPFVSLQSEGMWRRTKIGPVTGTDRGVYAQASVGFARPWVLSARYDFVDQEVDPDRHRASAALTYFPSEFSKIRLQYNYDRTRALEADDSHAVYVQAEISFGAHGAHKF